MCTQVVECLHHDGTYGPFVDRIKHTIGLEYEYLLQEKLRQLNVRVIMWSPEGDHLGVGLCLKFTKVRCFSMCYVHIYNKSLTHMITRRWSLGWWTLFTGVFVVVLHCMMSHSAKSVTHSHVTPTDRVSFWRHPAHQSTRPDTWLCIADAGGDLRSFVPLYVAVVRTPLHNERVRIRPWYDLVDVSILCSCQIITFYLGEVINKGCRLHNEKHRISVFISTIISPMYSRWQYQWVFSRHRGYHVEGVLSMHFVVHAPRDWKQSVVWGWAIHEPVWKRTISLVHAASWSW